ncbi:MAG: ABC transporter permease [Cyanobacteriota bacterium]|nr:ABC transporter permease [Cyanobacteriota bacterium]
MSLSPFDLISMTSSSLRGNLLRSSLTTLGVFMGVFAVTASLQVRSISSQVVAEQLAKKDVPHVRISVWGEQELQLEHVEFLKQRLIGWKAIAGVAFANWDDLRFRDRTTEVRLQSISSGYFDALGTVAIKGNLFSDTEHEQYRSVAIIDELLETELFKAQNSREKDINPIGQLVYMEGKPYRVVGVIKSSSGWVNQNVVLIPQSTYYASTASRDLSWLIIRPREAKDLERLGNQAEQLLQERLQPRYISQRNNLQDIQEQQTTLDMVSNSLLLLAGISLLVGGVGIANITIASVTERTKEIGLRRAIGATSYEIVLQFILEAVFLSLLGGVSAIITVHGLTVLVTDNHELPYQFEATTAVFSLSSALLVGVGAGFLPALQASKIDPVKALRS